MLTLSEKKALQIIEEGVYKTPNSFAKKYFKGMDILERSSNIGNGATRGVGAWFQGGVILGRLTKKGLIEGGPKCVLGGSYVLTPKGKEELEKSTDD